MDLDQLVEAGARALYQHFCDEQIEECAPWERLGDKASWLDRSTAHLAAILPLLADDLAGIFPEFDHYSRKAIRTRLTELGEKQ